MRSGKTWANWDCQNLKIEADYIQQWRFETEIEFGTNVSLGLSSPSIWR
jgi:hypothetical protein